MAANSSISQAFIEIEGKLKNYLKRFLDRQQDIDDAVQETFTRAFEAEGKREIHAPKSFMFRVARNLALSELTRKTNQMIESVGDIEELNVLMDNSSVSHHYETDCYFNALLLVVDSLPPRCRKVLVLRKVYGYSQKEISRELDISVKTVEKHLTKALKKCQEMQADTTVTIENDVQECESDEKKVVA